MRDGAWLTQRTPKLNTKSVLASDLRFLFHAHARADIARGTTMTGGTNAKSNSRGILDDGNANFRRFAVKTSEHQNAGGTIMAALWLPARYEDARSGIFSVPGHGNLLAVHPIAIELWQANQLAETCNVRAYLGNMTTTDNLYSTRNYRGASNNSGFGKIIVAGLRWNATSMWVYSDNYRDTMTRTQSYAYSDGTSDCVLYGTPLTTGLDCTALIWCGVWLKDMGDEHCRTLGSYPDALFTPEWW